MKTYKYYGKRFHKRFVKELCNNVRDELLRQIKDNKVPENWDGIELRWLLKEKFSNEVLDSYKDKQNKRFKDFKNECLVSNLY